MYTINKIFNLLTENIPERTTTTFFFPPKTEKFITIYPESLSTKDTTVSSLILKNKINVLIVNIINKKSNFLNIYNELLDVTLGEVLPLLKPFKIDDGIDVVLSNDGSNSYLGLKFSITTEISC